MDSQKHSWPRSRSMSSKEFSSFARPRLSSTTLLIHGFLCLVALSPHLVSTNSSRSAEILCAGLTTISKRIDLTSCFLNIQADNCVKEIKNNGTLRLVAMWVALHRICGAELSFLSSGHSHEDVDALFNLLRAHLEANKELWTPQAFRECLQTFFNDPRNRPYEPERNVVLLNQFRDWTLHLYKMHFSFFVRLFSTCFNNTCGISFNIASPDNPCVTWPFAQEDLAPPSLSVCSVIWDWWPGGAPFDETGEDWFNRRNQSYNCLMSWAVMRQLIKHRLLIPLPIVWQEFQERQWIANFGTSMATHQALPMSSWGHSDPYHTKWLNHLFAHFCWSPLFIQIQIKNHSYQIPMIGYPSWPQSAPQDEAVDERWILAAPHVSFPSGLGCTCSGGRLSPRHQKFWMCVRVIPHRITVEQFKIDGRVDPTNIDALSRKHIIGKFCYDLLW